MKWLSNKQKGLRWIVLIIVVSCILFNTIFSLRISALKADDLGAMYRFYLGSPGTTFIMFILIHLAFLIYAIVQMMPVQRNDAIFDRIAVPVIGVNLLYSLGTVFYFNSFNNISLLVFLFALLFAFYAFRKAYIAVQYHNFNLWLQFPFSLISGWLTVLFATVFIEYISVSTFSQNVDEGFFAVVLIISLTGIAYAISVSSYSLVYPAVVAWGLYTFGQVSRNESSEITTASLIAVVILTAGTFLTSTLRKTKFKSRVNDRNHIHKRARTQHS